MLFVVDNKLPIDIFNIRVIVVSLEHIEIRKEVKWSAKFRSKHFFRIPHPQMGRRITSVDDEATKCGD